jgi:hypothetical protein
MLRVVLPALVLTQAVYDTGAVATPDRLSRVAMRSLVPSKIGACPNLPGIQPLVMVGGAAKLVSAPFRAPAMSRTIIPPFSLNGQ